MRRSISTRCTGALTAVLLSLIATACFAANQPISATEAAQHVGERETVCGSVASTHFASQSRGQPTFLNLDKPYPSQIFTVVIWGSARRQFSDPPEMYYSHKDVCVNGVIKNYRGTPEIVVKSPSQIYLK